MARVTHARVWYIAGVALTIFVVTLSLLPARDVPRIGVSDKIEHAAAFALLTVWFAGLVTPRHYIWLALALLGLGGGIEIAQWVMGLGRYADVRDFIADGVGIAFGLTLSLLGLRHWAGFIERRWRR